MLIFRKIGGIFLLLIGLVGVAACAAAIYKAGIAGHELSRITERTFDSVENGMQVAGDQFHGTALSLAQVRSNLEAVIKKAESFRPEDMGDVREKVSNNQVPVVFDPEITQKLMQAQRMLGSAEVALGALTRLMKLMHQWGLLDADNKADGPAMRIEKTSATLRELSDTLDNAIVTARDLKDRSRSERLLQQWTGELRRLAKELAIVQTLESDFKALTQKVKARLLHYEENILRWIHMGEVFLPLLLVWLGLGQAALIILGGQMLFRKRGR